MYDKTFENIDEPDGSMKGKHKLVGRCFSVKKRTKVRNTLINTANK